MESVRATANTMMAGPLFRAGEVTDALIEALQEDNPGKELKVRDASGYIRVEGAGGLTLHRRTVEEVLGRSFSMQEIEIHMTGFSGKIEMTADTIRWFFRSIP
jgi:toluene monooxygenase system protein D